MDIRFDGRGEEDPDLLRILRAAAAALEDEDARLRAAFINAPPELQSFYGRTPLERGGPHATNRGLAYPLFESTLVYTIFRAWIPLVPVIWDYDRAGTRGPIDLTVRHDAESKKTKWAFEAKWWGNSAGTRAMVTDTRKLQDPCVTADRRFLIGLWWCRADKYGAWDDKVILAGKNFGWSRVFAATFPTAIGGDAEHLFVVDVLEVPPR
ncbi:MAG: hypothetical protein CMN30_33970 [Sandaracinus sp.]|nr:hypothetical protein [Sandaracinus sp.]|tara:strand:- start:2126 stop:2752 length:627 start_codon:yes stop_codon:yes gene_type:complete